VHLSPDSLNLGLGTIIGGVRQSSSGMAEWRLRGSSATRTRRSQTRGRGGGVHEQRGEGDGGEGAARRSPRERRVHATTSAPAAVRADATVSAARRRGTWPPAGLRVCAGRNREGEMGMEGVVAGSGRREELQTGEDGERVAGRKGTPPCGPLLRAVAPAPSRRVPLPVCAAGPAARAWPPTPAAVCSHRGPPRRHEGRRRSAAGRRRGEGGAKRRKGGAEFRAGGGGGGARHA